MNNVGSINNRSFNVFTDIISRSTNNASLTTLSSDNKKVTGKNFDSSVVTKFKAIQSNMKFRTNK